ncbi:MAG: hypothetical protein ACRD2N_07480 [Vicinamibacterales bacterium]
MTLDSFPDSRPRLELASRQYIQSRITNYEASKAFYVDKLNFRSTWVDGKGADVKTAP